MPEQQAVLFANSAFYAAFATRDIGAMEAVWSKEKPVSCTHPGWQPLVGRKAVMESWRSILANPAAPHIACRADRAAVYGDMAVVTCIEQIADPSGPPQFLTATNIFAKAGAVWVMVHHQAGPVQVDPSMLEDEEKPQMN
jgi:hypothetical protein